MSEGFAGDRRHGQSILGPVERTFIDRAAGGPTDQRNRNIACRFHNPAKHRERWRTRRDRRGRAYTLRDDGTIILPVGERPPDLSVDEMNELARARLRRLLGGRGSTCVAQAHASAATTKTG